MNETLFYAITIFIIGLCIGSFMNVCIYRLPRGESIAFPPSHCTNCGNNIKAYQLIPVVSYIFLRGSCAYCKAHISLRYPIIEFLNGIVWVFIFLLFGLSIISGVLMLATSFLGVLALVLYDNKRLRN